MVWKNLFGGQEERLLAISTLRQRYPNKRLLLDAFQRRLNAETDIKVTKAVARYLAERVGLLPQVNRRKPAVMGNVIMGTPIDQPTGAQSRRAKTYSTEELRNGPQLHRG